MMVKVSNPRRAEIYISGCRHTAEQIRALTGADVVINGGLFDMSSKQPVCHLRVKGIDYASDKYEYTGYGWNSGNARMVPLSSRNKVTVDNYICDSWMISDGKPVDMIYAAAQGGKRGNTAIGRLADGSLVVNVHTDYFGDQITPENMQKEMLAVGCIDAMRLDGGQSSALSTDGLELFYANAAGAVRRCHNYICLWGEVSHLDTFGKNKEESKVYKLALDAGHGINSANRIPKSLDPNETREWQLNDRVADKIEELLKGYKNISILRLDDSDDGAEDVPLSTRTNKANAWGADLYLSIHHNAAYSDGRTGSWSGIVAYSYPNSTGGAEWRDAFFDALIAATGLKGDRWDGTQTATYHVLRETNAPAVLLELGFQDSVIDVPKILSDNFAQDCAAAIVETIARRWGLTKVNTEAEPAPAPSGAESAVSALGKAVSAGIAPADAKRSDAVTWGEFAAALEKLGHLL